jgi:hypothetical protein
MTSGQYFFDRTHDETKNTLRIFETVPRSSAGAMIHDGDQAVK